LPHRITARVRIGWLEFDAASGLRPPTFGKYAAVLAVSAVRIGADDLPETRSLETSCSLNPGIDFG
jgi:hypothetical protein